ncbi:hypothetical protein [Nonlabens sp. SY33080]|uniref:hypothetical protein n=1 Tax=Nonlabens sp. SY33080 TaxID=2719911 RepID=UPI001428B0B2|nr:hypothetical protein [Nonlabens sp. SY33080]
MKSLISVFLVFAFAKAITAQVHSSLEHLKLPQISQADNTAKNEVYRIQTATYKADSLGYEPVVLEVQNFNEEGLKFQDYQQIFGKYKSETLDSFYYTGTRLDSIVKKTSSGGFDATMIFECDNQGRVTSEKATGKYINYVTQYTYENNQLQHIEMKLKRGNRRTATYYYKKGNLDYVKQHEYKENGELKKEFTVYYTRGIPIARVTANDPLITVADFTGVYKIRTQLSQEQAIEALQKAAAISRTDLFNKRKEITQQEVMLEQYSTSTESSTGEWTKRHITRKMFSKLEDRWVFRKLYFPDSTTVGSTQFDILFQHKIKRY